MENWLASAREPDRRSAGARRQQWLVALVIFAAALWLYSRHNTFPFYYHPDEAAKVAQIHNGTRNFNHPLLLLSATELTTSLTGRRANCQLIVQLGRWWSAVFAATAVAAFSWLGFNRCGLIGGLVCGGAVLVQRRLYEYAHFMKEDAALIAAIALTFVAIDAWWRRPGLARALLLGAAAGLAASSKYVGLLMLPIAALAILAAGEKSLGKLKGWAALLGGFLIVAAIINYPALLSPGDITRGITGEIGRLNSRGGVPVHFSPLDWIPRFLELSPVLLGMFVYHVAWTLRRFRTVEMPDLLLTVFPFAFGLLLSLSSKQGGRHVLPITIVAVFLGALALVRLANELQRGRTRFAVPLFTILLVVAFAYDLVRTSLLHRGFQRDHRQELVEWITSNVPPAAVVGVEERVGILHNRRGRGCEVPSPLAQQVRTARFAPDLGALDELRAAGVTHLALTDAYKLFLEPEFGPSRDATFQRRREFYQRVFSEGRLVWSRDSGTVGVLNPGLRLYDITAPFP